MPEVSVVVATHNRAARLAMLLESLRHQTFTDFELLITDDGSTDHTQDVLAQATDLPLRVFRNQVAHGPAAARNRGIRAARGRLVALVDDDCVATPGWLEAGVRAWGGDDTRFVQGSVGPIESERPKLGAFSYTILVEGPTPNCEGANMFYARSLLDQLGGFDETFPEPAGEDADLGCRARATGAAQIFEADARVEHAVVEIGVFGYLRRLWRWSYAMRVYADHPEMRRHLHRRVFWNFSHYLLLRAVLGVVIATRSPWLVPVGLWLAKWFVEYEVRESRKHAGTPWLAPWWAVRDVVEIAACIRGGIRYRVLVL